MQNFGTSPSYSANWGGVGSSTSTSGVPTGSNSTGGNNGIWASPIGSGIRTSAGESSRNNPNSHTRPPPLSSRALAVSETERPEDSPMNGFEEAKTGSGVLVATSESDDWNNNNSNGSNSWRQSRPQAAAAGNLSAPLASARTNQSNASPVRQRTNQPATTDQNTRNSSPYFSPPQPSIFSAGSATATNPSNRSSLDPTSRSFYSGQQAGGYQASIRRDSDDAGRRNPFSVNFGSLASVGNGGSGSYSGYNSAIASRSGSLPPSRHGQEPQQPQQQSYGELAGLMANGQSNNNDALIYHRQNQSSRTSTTLSLNSNNSAGRYPDPQWQTNVNDLSSMTARLDLGRNSIDNSPAFPGYWDIDGQFQVSPAAAAALVAAANAASTGNGFGASSAGGHTPNYSSQRNGSSSVADSGGRELNDGALQNANGYTISQQQQQNGRRAYGEQQSSISPTAHEVRRQNESPSYFNGNTPPLSVDHSRGVSVAGSKSNFADNSALLDRRLRGLQEQQQQQQLQLQQHQLQLQQQTSFLQSPSGGFRQGPFTNVFDFSAPQASRMNPQPPPFYPSMPMGYASMPQQPSQQQAPHGQVINSLNHGHSQRLPPRGPAGDTNGELKLRSALLEDFRIHKASKKFDIKDIYDHIVEFSGDQHGSRFIQTKLETANSDEKSQLFKEILPNALQLMTDVFGNYVIQKFFEHGNQGQKKLLADKMRGHLPELSVQMYGCRVVQKAFEHILVDQQAQLVRELEPHVGNCIRDQNGNHVIQKIIQRVPEEHISFIIDSFTGEVQTLAAHSYGCRVVQRMLEHCRDPVRANIMEELHACSASLVTDQYGNYVTQHIIMHGGPSDRRRVIELVTRNLVSYCKHKFASNVVEKSFQHGTEKQKRKMIEIITGTGEAHTPVAPAGMTGAIADDNQLQIIMRDQYGNYVIQKILKELKGIELEGFISRLKPPLERLKTINPFSKQVAQIDRLVHGNGTPNGRNGASLTANRGNTSASASVSRSSSSRPSRQHTPTSTPSTPSSPLLTSSSSSPHQDRRHHHSDNGGNGGKTRPPNLDISSATAAAANAAPPTPPLVNEDAQSPQSSSQPSTSNSTVDGPTTVEVRSAHHEHHHHHHPHDSADAGADGDEDGVLRHGQAGKEVTLKVPSVTAAAVVTGISD